MYPSCALTILLDQYLPPVASGYGCHDCAYVAANGPFAAAGVSKSTEKVGVRPMVGSVATVVGCGVGVALLLDAPAGAADDVARDSGTAAAVMASAAAAAATRTTVVARLNTVPPSVVRRGGTGRCRWSVAGIPAS